MSARSAKGGGSGDSLKNHGVDQERTAEAEKNAAVSAPCDEPELGGG